MVTLWGMFLFLISNYDFLLTNQISICSIIILTIGLYSISSKVKKTIITYIEILWIIYALLVLLSLIVNPTVYSELNLNSILKLIVELALIPFLLGRTIHNTKTIKLILNKLFIASAYFSLIIFFLYLLDSDFLVVSSGGRVGGIFGEVNYNAILLSALLPIGFLEVIKNPKTGEKLKYSIAIISSIIAVLATGSRTGLILLFLAPILTLFFIKKTSFKRSFSFISAIISIVILYVVLYNYLPTIFITNLKTRFEFNDYANLDKFSGSRISILEHGLSAINESPLLGKGINGFYYWDKIHFGQGFGVHNIFIDIATNYGLTGLLIFLIIFTLAIKTSWEIKQQYAIPLLFFIIVIVGLMTVPAGNLIIFCAMTQLASLYKVKLLHSTVSRKPSFNGK